MYKYSIVLLAALGSSTYSPAWAGHGCCGGFFSGWSGFGCFGGDMSVGYGCSGGGWQPVGHGCSGGGWQPVGHGCSGGGWQPVGYGCSGGGWQPVGYGCSGGGWQPVGHGCTGGMPVSYGCYGSRSYGGLPVRSSTAERVPMATPIEVKAEEATPTIESRRDEQSQQPRQEQTQPPRQEQTQQPRQEPPPAPQPLSGGFQGGFGAHQVRQETPPEAKPPAVKEAAVEAIGEPEEEAMTPAPATILIQLPAEAKLSVNNRLTQTSSSTRKFVSPVLKPGKDFYYTLKAEMVQDGETVTTTKRIAVRAGEEKNIRLEFPKSRTVTQN